MEAVDVGQIVVYERVGVGRRVGIVRRERGMLLFVVVGLDHGLRQRLQSLAAAGHAGNEAHAHVRREAFDVERRTTFGKLVPKVERPHGG